MFGGVLNEIAYRERIGEKRYEREWEAAPARHSSMRPTCAPVPMAPSRANDHWLVGAAERMVTLSL